MLIRSKSNKIHLSRLYGRSAWGGHKAQTIGLERLHEVVPPTFQYHTLTIGGFN